MPESVSKTVEIILKSGFGQQEWDLTLPLDKAVHQLISRITREASLGLRPTDDDGNRIPYRIMWVEENRYLNETETLGGAGVGDHHTLVLTQEARAGNQH